jgi:hypothetical protein
MGAAVRMKVLGRRDRVEGTVDPRPDGARASHTVCRVRNRAHHEQRDEGEENESDPGLVLSDAHRRPSATPADSSSYGRRDQSCHQ